jgi:hypothetical protein
MKWLREICLVAIWLAITPNHPASAVTLLNENFKTIGAWTDLSKAVTWGNNPVPVSAFTTLGGSVSLTSQALNYTGYTAPNSLKTFTALDYRFSQPLQHDSNILTIDFRARWNSVDRIGSGESGRLMLILNHSYPTGGLNVGIDNRYDDFDAAWWASPAYHLRIRAGSTSNPQGTTLLQYGGGLTAAGEYERYDDPSTPKNPDWWLPGFISGAGGISPGVGPSYPRNSWVQTATGTATTSLRSYRYVLKPDAQEFWFDSNNDRIFQNNELAAKMPLPITHAQAPLYQYFPSIEGIRIYWRGAGGAGKGQVFLDHLTVRASPASNLFKSTAQAIPEPSLNFAWLGIAGLGLLYLRQRMERR